MKVSWVFDVISPFSYLGFQQLRALPAGTEVELVPVLFAGLLNHYGQLGPAEIEPKRRFTYRFIVWRARKLGVPLKMPPVHPFNPLSAMRLIIAAGGDMRAVRTGFDFVWAHDTAFSSVVSPRYCSSSSADIDSSNFDGPLLGQSSRSDCSPWSRRRSTTPTRPCARRRRTRRAGSGRRTRTRRSRTSRGRAAGPRADTGTRSRCRRR